MTFAKNVAQHSATIFLNIYRAQSKIRNLIFLFLDVQRNFRNKLFNLVEARCNYAIFRTKSNFLYQVKAQPNLHN